MKYMRVYTDADGESHFEDVTVEFQEINFSPPTPPVGLSAFAPATQWAFFTLPPGWGGDWHPTPRRQIFFYLAGEAEIEVSDGETRRFGPGDAALLFEDTTGKGHQSRVIGTDRLVLAVVQLPD